MRKNLRFIKTIRKNNFSLIAEINMIPMLDILLVLLIIMIASMPMLTHNIELNLPNIKEMNKQIKYKKNTQVIIEISNIEKYSIIINNHRIDQLKINELTEKILYFFKKYPEIFFIIAGNKNVLYDEIVKIINVLHSIGITEVGLMGKIN